MAAVLPILHDMSPEREFIRVLCHLDWETENRPWSISKDAAYEKKTSLKKGQYH